MSIEQYRNFIASKSQHVSRKGFWANDLPEALSGHQRHMVEFACEIGSAACFYDTGLGKTFIELAYADQVRRHSGKPVLLLAPLAVGHQTAREAGKFGIDGAAYVSDPGEVKPGMIAVTNYERMKLFRPSDFGGVVIDESSIMKSFTGATTRALISAWNNHEYRLAATATPAPNDHMELGQHSQFLGVMDSNEMLSRWFIADQSQMGRYRLKGHAVTPFWRWVASWARAATRPSDVGQYSDAGYDLTPFVMRRHVVETDISIGAHDMLFRIPDMSATSMHQEKRLTVEGRARVIADLVAAEPGESWIVWCDTDYEADALLRVIPDAIEVRGSHKPEVKEERLLAFSEGRARVLITKPKIAGFGLNWQHCARVAFVGLSYSYEAFYQAIRRCWRFGQTREVQVHVAMAATERTIWDTIVRKRDDHHEMSRRMVAAMRQAGQSDQVRKAYTETKPAFPAWIRSDAA
jgi:superfamily II DNA or RNA helicase